MELNQKLTFIPSRFLLCCKGLPRQFALTPYYSSSLGYDILLYESLLLNFCLKFIDFFINLPKKLIKIMKISIFHFFHFFRKFVLTFFLDFDLSITYRPQMSIAQIDRLNEIFPKMHSNKKSNGWSAFKNQHF